MTSYSAQVDKVLDGVLVVSQVAAESSDVRAGMCGGDVARVDAVADDEARIRVVLSADDACCILP